MAGTNVNCDALIASDIDSRQCERPLVQGLEAVGVIVNRQDVDFNALEQDNVSVRNLPLKNGKKGYKIYQPAKAPFSGTQKAMEEGTYGNTFTNTVQFILLYGGVEGAQAAKDLANGEFVVILENKMKEIAGGTNPGTFEVYGLDNGLKASAIVREPWSDETRGGWLVTLVEKGAPRPAVYLSTHPAGSGVSDNYGDCKAIVDGLVSGSNE